MLLVLRGQRVCFDQIERDQIGIQVDVFPGLAIDCHFPLSIFLSVSLSLCHLISVSLNLSVFFISLSLYLSVSFSLCLFSLCLSACNIYFPSAFH